MDINYQSYLKVDDLLELQVPLSEGPEHEALLLSIKSTSFGSSKALA